MLLCQKALILLSNPKEKVVFDKESHLRSILKGVSWRIIGTLDTMVISYFITGSITFALSIGSIEVVSKFVLYYLHERFWQLAPRGYIRQGINKLWKK